MATLKAHGTEVARYRTVAEEPDFGRDVERLYSLRSDGWVLVKVRWAGGPWGSWRSWYRYQRALPVSRYTEHAEALHARLLRHAQLHTRHHPKAPPMLVEKVTA